MVVGELDRSNRGRLPPSVGAPAYDPARVTPGIVHLAPAHSTALTWPATRISSWSATRRRFPGASPAPGRSRADQRVRDSLAPQDGLYTLVERDGATERAGAIGSIAEVIYAAELRTALLARVDQTAARIAGLTISEDGYCPARCISGCRAGKSCRRRSDAG